MKHMSKTRS